MEKSIITTGKTIDEAIAVALAKLGMDRDSVSVEVLERARSGFLGFGSSPAKVKVTYEVPDEEPVVEAAPAAPVVEETPAPAAPVKESLDPKSNPEDLPF